MSERVRVPDGHGGAVRPGRLASGPMVAQSGDVLYPGDRLENGDGRACSQFLRRGGFIRVSAHTKVIVPPFGGVDLIVLRGELASTTTAESRQPDSGSLGSPPSVSPTPSLVVDLPGTRFVAPATSQWLAVVADDGQTDARYDARSLGLYPLPPPPPPFVEDPPSEPPPLARSADGGFRVRAGLRLPLTTNHLLLFGPNGAVLPPPPVALSPSGFAAWREPLDATVAARNGHLAPLSRPRPWGGGRSGRRPRPARNLGERQPWKCDGSRRFVGRHDPHGRAEPRPRRVSLALESHPRTVACAGGSRAHLGASGRYRDQPRGERDDGKALGAEPLTPAGMLDRGFASETLGLTELQGDTYRRFRRGCALP